MAEIVNLRRARKNKARSEREAQAAENRLKFGRSKVERDFARAETRLADARLDGVRLIQPDET